MISCNGHSIYKSLREIRFDRERKTPVPKTIIVLGTGAFKLIVLAIMTAITAIRPQIHRTELDE